MEQKDLFQKPKAKKINESLAKTFGKKINLESFSQQQLEDARNKLRTQLSQVRSGSSFNENLENDAYYKAQFMLDAINAEILNREQISTEDYDKDEYDEEGEMTKSQLRVINDAAEELHSILDNDENLPEWVQKKISLAMDYIDTARDYIKANPSEDDTDDTGMMGVKEDIVAEGEVQQASAIVTAKTMVDRVGRWIEELSGMENETLLQLGDSIRDEMGQEAAKNFISQVAPAIQQALETLKGTRETLSGGVNQLATGESPVDMLGAEPAEGGEADMAAPAEPDAMNMPAEEPASDEFAAAEPAAGGAEAAGREQRESINFQNRLLKVLAG